MRAREGAARWSAKEEGALRLGLRGGLWGLNFGILWSRRAGAQRSRGEGSLTARFERGIVDFGILWSRRAGARRSRGGLLRGG